MNQLDIFGEAEKPKGLLYFPEFITLEEELFLLEKFRTIEWEEFQMQGVIAKRKIAQFGLDYTFDSRSVTPSVSPPAYLYPLIQKVSKTMKVKPGEIAEILFSYYPPGAPIGWHRDAPMFEDVFGISLASSTWMKFRLEQKESRKDYKIFLERRSGYLLKGPARWAWKHHIPKVRETRYSITFRTLKKA